MNKKPPGPPQPSRGRVRETLQHSEPASDQHARAGGKGEKSKRVSGPPCYIDGLSTCQRHKGATHDTRPVHIHPAPPAGRPDGDAPGNGRLSQLIGSRVESRMAASSSISYLQSPHICSHAAGRPGRWAVGNGNGAGLPAPLTGKASSASIKDRRLSISKPRFAPLNHGVAVADDVRWGTGGECDGFGRLFWRGGGGGGGFGSWVGVGGSATDVGPIHIGAQRLACHRPMSGLLNLHAALKRHTALA